MTLLPMTNPAGAAAGVDHVSDLGYSRGHPHYDTTLYILCED
jgi:hypothetical protein